jgi:sugar lactone lactonase YvrE
VEWKSGAAKGQVVAGGNGKGNKLNQLNCPSDVIVDQERNNLIICDYNNRRIVKWPLRNGTSGQTIISNIDCCRLAMDNNGYLYVSDCKKDEVRRWKLNETNGTLVAGGNGKGKNCAQLDWPTCIFVDEDHSVYVSDCNNHRVMKWIEGAKEGIVVAGSQCQGSSLAHLSYPVGLIVDDSGTIYVADRNNHRIMRWYKGAPQGEIVIGRFGKGAQVNQLNWPMGLSFDQHEMLYIVDYNNHRIQKFNIDRS